MKFPKIIQNKKTKVEVTIYGKSKGGERKKDGSVTQPYPFYRLCWQRRGAPGQFPLAATDGVARGIGEVGFSF